MKLINHSKKELLIKQKKKYLVLGILILLGIIVGSLFLFFISKEDKLSALKYMDSFFDSIKTGENLHFSKALINSLLSNVLYIVIIWLLGISIIGIPIILGILVFKSFILGFSFTTIIYNYGFKGVLGAFLYTFPHQVGYLLILIFLSFYALNFSIKLFKSLFLKATFNFRELMHRYLKVLTFCLIVGIILSFFEIYIGTYLLKLFTLLLK